MSGYHWVGETREAPELLPCPFCGSPARFSVYGKDAREFTIGCSGVQTSYGAHETNCPAWNHVIEENRDGNVRRAAERWNRRVPL